VDQNVEVNNSSNSGLEKDGSRLDTQPLSKIPGGIISFLFEKFSEPNLDDIVDE